MAEKLIRVTKVAWLFLAMFLPSWADPAPVIHYAPAENLEHVDVVLIDRADKAIDLAAYVLTDWPVMHALTRAANRGVLVSIYLGGGQIANQEPGAVFEALKRAPGVEIRVKPKDRSLMHLKAYQIDGRLLRTGSANFSASGLKRQDNDLVVIESTESAAAFKRNFEARFAGGERLSAGAR